MRVNQSIFCPFILVTLLMVCGCSKTERVPDAHLEPTPSEIGAWSLDIGKRVRLAGSPYEKGVLVGVQETIAAMRNRTPISLNIDGLLPMVTTHRDYAVPQSTLNGTTTTIRFSGVDVRVIHEGEIDEEFGLPQHLTGACDPGDAEDLRQIGQRMALRWYADRGIYPINSTKRKLP